MESGYQKKTGWGVYIDVQYVILLILKSSLFQGSKFANRDVDILILHYGSRYSSGTNGRVTPTCTMHTAPHDIYDILQ